MTTTQFNPFGVYESTVYGLREELGRVSKRFEKELVSGYAKHGLSAESRGIGKIFDTAASVAKAIDEAAIQSLVTEIVTPLAAFASTLSQHGAEKMKAHEQMLQIRNLSKFIQIVADRVVEPFDSELLASWAPLLDALCTAKSIGLRESGVTLWKATFGKVRTALKYPPELREKLEKVSKRHGFHVPPAETPAQQVFLDDNDEEAMDGMSSAPEVVEKAAEPADSVESSTFQLSQQADANALAEKLLAEQKQQPKAPKETAETPKRRSAKFASLLDEDSCDFVPIVATPPSSLRRNRLTDRQREKLAEAVGPRTTVNYVDEESQSAPQKELQLKAALAANNYDVNEESQSVPSPKNEERPMEVPLSIPRYPRRSRKLFDSPAKPETSETTTKATSEDVAEPPEVVHEEPTTPVKKKTGGRPKKTPRQCLPDKSPPRKRLRSAKSEEPSEPKTSEQQKTCEDVEDDGDVVMTETEPQTASESAEDVEAVVEEEVPKTPSILRVKEKSVEPPGSPSILKKKVNTPANDRKKNRVHFGEESLPSNDVTSPLPTPRRLQSHSVVLAIDTKSPQKTSKDATSSADVVVAVVPSSESPTTAQGGLLELQHRSSPFYPSLVGCVDPIDLVVRSLSPFNLKTAIDATRRSLHSAGVKTIGDLAALPKRQISELEIRKPREKSAKSVLGEYEAKKRAETRASEERILHVEPEDVVVDAVAATATATSEDVAPPKSQPLLETGNVARKSLAPIFEKSTTNDVKKEVSSPQKPLKLSSSTLDDCRSLQKVSQSLSMANFLKKVPATDWAAHLPTICKAVTLFDDIVQKRGVENQWGDDDDDEDDDVDNDDDVDGDGALPKTCQTSDDVRAAVKTLNRLYRRLLRHHSTPGSEWRGSMHAITEAALLLRNIVVEQAARQK